jgi:hypothetical protein
MNALLIGNDENVLQYTKQAKQAKHENYPKHADLRIAKHTDLTIPPRFTNTIFCLFAIS